jgi:hypothetical protein
VRGVLVGRHLGPSPPAGDCATRRSRSLIVAPRHEGLRCGTLGDGYLGSWCGRRRAGGGSRRWRTRRPLQPRRSPTSTPPPTASPARGGGAFGFGSSGRRQIVQEVDALGSRRVWAKGKATTSIFLFPSRLFGLHGCP